MNGLELSERYYREACAPMLARLFPALVPRVAAGLVGEGSECLGFDDELSRDHDWGAALCLWLSERDNEESGGSLRRALSELPRSIHGYPVREENARTAGRTGVFEINRFYSRYLGQDKLPDALVGWLSIPEENLAAATNGAVFADPCGHFTHIRNQLLDFYPEDVRRKKIAARCATIAQAGQYNVPRCMARKEYVAAALAEAAFIDAACSAVFLLNKRYKPFFKWAHRAMSPLPVLGQEVFRSLSCFVEAGGDPPSARDKKTEIIEDISAKIARELVQQELSDATGDFLLEHALSVQGRIQDPDIRNIHVLVG